MTPRRFSRGAVTAGIFPVPSRRRRLGADLAEARTIGLRLLRDQNLSDPAVPSMAMAAHAPIPAARDNRRERLSWAGRRHSHRISGRANNPPELRLTRQKGCIGDRSRLADIVVGMGETTMCAVAIRDDISSQELRRRARQESDGRVARVCSRSPTRWKGWTGRPCATGVHR